MKKDYQLSIEDVFQEYHTTGSGLSNDDVTASQLKHGLNELQEPQARSRLVVFFSQFTDLMTIILLIAAFISFFADEKTDAFVILAIVIANAWMGYSQTSKAEHSIRMLRKISTPFSMVVRSNNPQKIKSAELVPGDIMLLGAGDIVPADGRLFEISAFRTDESSLTGESNPVDKSIGPIDKGDLVPADQVNKVFKGTMVTNGTAKVIVTATGMNTEFGKIASLMEVPTLKTPLQKRLTVFSRQLVIIVIVICLLVFGIGMMQNEEPLKMFLTSLSLAVAALPEALPAVITIALAGGARRMVKQKALVRRLPAVETLGSVTYICTDKTGTLTQNVMKVEQIFAVSDQEKLLHYAMMLNHDVQYSKEKLHGDSTEIAMIDHASEKMSREEAESTYPVIKKIPFDSTRMRMSSLHKNENEWMLIVKGAPAKIVEVLSGKYKTETEGWLETNRKWASEGMRVLFFAYKKFQTEPALAESLEQELEFLGMVGMIDPPREEVLDAIRECTSAGIKTVMITGDQKLTAKAIADRLNITEFHSRVSPEQKVNIVKELQSKGEFVAMTGDGVNDAPSLKTADIGIAMGITGTDVAKEAADLVLLDDNFATIVKAVKEGRRIYDNIKKFILYVLSCNLSEILTILLAPVFGFVIPLLPIHILWINLVTDGLPGIALVGERAEKNIMQRSPRPTGENLFAGGMVKNIISSAIIMTAATLSIQWWAKTEGYGVDIQQTMVFTTLCFVQLGNALSVRSISSSVFGSGINKGMFIAIAITVSLQILLVYLPVLHPVFKTTSINLQCVIMIGIVTVLSTMMIELVKWATFKFSK